MWLIKIERIEFWSKANLSLGLNLQVLAKHKGLQWDKVLRLEEVQTQLGISLEEMLLVTEDALHAEPYSREEVCRCLGISLEELRTQILSPNTQDGESAGPDTIHRWKCSNFALDIIDLKLCFKELGECVCFG